MSRNARHMPFALLSALTATLAGLALAPAGALASPADLAATHAYVQADAQLVQAAWSKIRPAEATLRRLLGQVRSECPLAAANSPQDVDSEQLSNEVIGTIVIAVVRLDPSAGRQFARVTKRLTWSNRSLTSTVHSYASHVATLVQLAPPKLCADVRAWAASGFQTLPSSTVSFDARFVPAWVAAGELPGALSPYETGEEQPLLRLTIKRESELSEFEAREVETWGHMMDALDLWP